MRNKLFILFVSFVSVFTLKASHIVGGEMMYKYVGRSGANYVYDIKLHVFFDCENANPGVIDSDVSRIDIHVFDSRTQQIIRSLSKDRLQGTDRIDVKKLNYNCIKNAPDACVERYTFTTRLTLPANNGGYTITFERCCRNEIIDNILNPGKTGATYFAEIKDVRLGNSSPVFKDLPPNFLCLNAPLNFDHSATDDDGDSLVYELYRPFLGGTDGQTNSTGVKPTIFDFNAVAPSFPDPNNNRNVEWAPGYSDNLQIDGNPNLSINRKTGKLNLTPTKISVYVVGIRVLEYRKGVLIGETKRDYQFHVSNCVLDVVASFFTPYLNCANSRIIFDNRSVGGTEYYWNFGNSEDVNGFSNLKTPSYTYQKPGFYTIKLITRTNNCVDSTEYDIEVKKDFKEKLPADTLFCGPFTRQISSSLNNKQYIWNTGERTKSITVNKAGLYFVTSTESPCSSRDTIIIQNDLRVIDLDPDSVICRDSFVQFTYLGKPGFSTYLWDDNTTKQEVFISKLGKYKVRASTENNCFSEDSITFVLYPPPRTRLYDTTICRGTSVNLDGLNYNAITQNETRYSWNSGENTRIINVQKEGEYIVTVKNKLCTIYDTAIIDYYFIGLDLGPDTFYCGPVNRILRTKYDYPYYLWNKEIEQKTLRVTNPGTFILDIVSKEGCLESDTINIFQYASIDGGLGNDTTICLSSKIKLTASDSMVSYLWNTGSTDRIITISDGGLYTVTVKNKNNCVISDSITITESPNALPIEMYMPDAFTPNEDEINDLYPNNKYADPNSFYELRIYNRWGEKLFVSNSPSIHWNGKIKDDMAPQDVYVYYVKYVGCDEKERWFRGTFTLLR